MRADADTLVDEVGAWSEIAQQLGAELCRSTEECTAQRLAAKLAELEVESLFARASIVRSACIEYHSLVCAFLSPRLFFAQCDSAVAELLAWKEIIDRQPLPYRETSVAEKEAAFAETMNAPTTQQLELERRRAEASKKEADEQLAIAVEKLAALRRERRQLEDQCGELAADRTSMEESLHTLRVQKLDERHRLEGELKTLRDQVHTERELLEKLKAANDGAAYAAISPAAASVSVARKLSVTSESPASHLASPAPAAAPRTAVTAEAQPTPKIRLERADSAHQGGSGPQSPYAGSPSPTREFTPSISSGLKALQSVREQLKDIREAHSQSSSMHRLSSAGLNGGNTGGQVGLSEPAGGVPRTSSSLSALPYVHSSNDLGSARAASPGQTLATPAANGEEVAASPWKQRLSKLQSDLKLLKAELGTTIQ